MTIFKLIPPWFLFGKYDDGIYNIMNTKLGNQVGGISESQKNGINLTYNKLEIFHGDTEMVDEGEGTPAEAMQLTLGELKKIDALGKQSIIAGKLSGYLQERYLEKHQQIHAHVMSINTRAQ